MNMFSIGKLLLTFRFSSVLLRVVNLIRQGIFIHQTNLKNNRRWLDTFQILKEWAVDKAQAMTSFNWCLVYPSDSVFYLSSIVIYVCGFPYSKENFNRTRIMYANKPNKILFKLSTFFCVLKKTISWYLDYMKLPSDRSSNH